MTNPTQHVWRPAPAQAGAPGQGPYPQQYPNPSAYPTPYPAPYPYPYPYPYPTVAPYPPPPRPGSSKILIGVVIAIVIAGALLCALPVFLLQQSINNLETTPEYRLTGSITEQQNPSVGEDTRNGGVLRLQISSTSAPVRLTAVTIELQDERGVRAAELLPDGTGPTARLGRETPTSSAPNLYIATDDVEPPTYDAAPARDDDPFAATPLTGASGVTGEQVLTVQHAFLAYLDAEEDGMPSAGDMIYIYRSPSGSSQSQIGPGSLVRIIIVGQVAGSWVLP